MIRSFAGLVFHCFSELHQIMKRSNKYHISCTNECGVGKEEQGKTMKYLQPTHIQFLRVVNPCHIWKFGVLFWGNDWTGSVE